MVKFLEAGAELQNLRSVFIAFCPSAILHLWVHEELCCRA